MTTQQTPGTSQNKFQKDLNTFEVDLKSQFDSLSVIYVYDGCIYIYMCVWFLYIYIYIYIYTSIVHVLHTHTHIYVYICIYMCFPGDSDNKESAYNAGDPGSILKFGKTP